MKGAFSKVLSASGDEILCSPKKYLNQKKPLLEVTPTTLSVYSFQFMSAFQRIASLCRVVIQTNGYCPDTQTLTEPIALCGPLNWSAFSWDVVWWCTLGRLSRDSEIAGSFFSYSSAVRRQPWASCLRVCLSYQAVLVPVKGR